MSVKLKFWQFVFFIITAGTLGTAIGCTIAVHSVETLTFVAMSVVASIWIVISQFVRPILTSMDKAVRDAEESASR